MADTQTHLIDAVHARRLELGLTPPDVAAAGGPSVETQRKLANREGGEWRERTLLSLDRVLQWKSGTCQRILAGTAGTDPDDWIDHSSNGSLGYTAQDTANASDYVGPPIPAWIRPQSGNVSVGMVGSARVTANATSARATGTASDGMPTFSDPVAAISSAAWDFYNLALKLDGDAPATRVVRQAVVAYLHDLLVRDLSDETT